jgi:hypothetical protein
MAVRIRVGVLHPVTSSPKHNDYREAERIFMDLDTRVTGIRQRWRDDFPAPRMAQQARLRYLIPKDLYVHELKDLYSAEKHRAVCLGYPFTWRMSQSLNAAAAANRQAQDPQFQRYLHSSKCHPRRLFHPY